MGVARTVEICLVEIAGEPTAAWRPTIGGTPSRSRPRTPRSRRTIKMLSVLAAPLALQLPRTFPQPERVYGSVRQAVRNAPNSVHACVAGGSCANWRWPRWRRRGRSAARVVVAARARWARAVTDPTSEAAFAAAYVGAPVAFAARSAHGSVVTVVACGWRCLKFDEVEQGVAYVKQGTVADLQVPARDGGGGAGLRPAAAPAPQRGSSASAPRRCPAGWRTISTRRRGRRARPARRARGGGGARVNAAARSTTS